MTELKFIPSMSLHTQGCDWGILEYMIGRTLKGVNGR